MQIGKFNTVHSLLLSPEKLQQQDSKDILKVINKQVQREWKRNFRNIMLEAEEQMEE